MVDLYAICSKAAALYTCEGGGQTEENLHVAHQIII